jgi:hypothetical protein
MSDYGQHQLQQHRNWQEANQRLWTPPMRADVPAPTPDPATVVLPEPIAPPVAPVSETREAQLIALQDELHTLAAQVRLARDRVEQALGDEIPLVKARPSIRIIIRTVAVYYQISVNDILSHRRTAQVVHRRHIAMYLVKQMTLGSLAEIGRRFGGRDHSTAFHAIRKIGAQREVDPELDKQLTELTALLTLKDEQP